MSLRACSLVLLRSSAARRYPRNTFLPSKSHGLSKHVTSRRDLSSNGTTATKPPPVEAGESASSSAAATTEGGVVRCGPEDSVIVLNVGGKHFTTLRSTIDANAVLSNLVARAEAHEGLTTVHHHDKAVFVDRDPQHFPIILTFLRNKVEQLSFPKKHFKKSGDYVQLPSDPRQLRDLFVEVKHFGITELEDRLCHHSIMIQAVSAFSGTSNPFDVVSNMVKNVRRGLVALAGFSSLTLGANADLKLPTLKDFKKKEEEGEEPPPAEPAVA